MFWSALSLPPATVPGMVKAAVRPMLSASTARAALAATEDDLLLHAASSLLLLAGLRSGEATTLVVEDWQPGDDPRLAVRGLRTAPDRTIRVAPTAAAAVDAYLAGQDAEPGEPLLLGLRPGGRGQFLPALFRDAMLRAGLEVSVHDLRRAAVAEVVADGTPVGHVEAYFGISKADEGRKDPAPLRDGYDRGIAAVLEQAFAV